MKFGQWATKTLVSLFCGLNLFTVLFINQPAALSQRVAERIHSQLDPVNAYRVAMASWLVGEYAYLAGLDNRWQMFSYIYRDDWRYLYAARRADSRVSLLPLPLQSDRNFLESTFFDFREAKFQLNIYGERAAISAYADYLCRTYSGPGPDRILEIVVELSSRKFLERSEARRLGYHLEPQGSLRVVETIPCS